MHRSIERWVVCASRGELGLKEKLFSARFKRPSSLPSVYLLLSHPPPSLFFCASSHTSLRTLTNQSVDCCTHTRTHTHKRMHRGTYVIVTALLCVVVQWAAVKNRGPRGRHGHRVKGHVSEGHSCESGG